MSERNAHGRGHRRQRRHRRSDLPASCWTTAARWCRWRAAPPTFTHQHLHCDRGRPDRPRRHRRRRPTRWRAASRHDTVIHNAGVIRPALLHDVKLADLDTLVDLHLASAIQLVQAALPAMKAAGFGRVVLLSSRAALGLATRTSLLRPPRPACSAWRAPGRWSWRPTASPSTWSRRGRSRPTCSTASFRSATPRSSRSPPASRSSASASRPTWRMRCASSSSEHAGFVTGQVLYVCGGTSVGSLTL